jgi:hypothetical protein
MFTNRYENLFLCLLVLSPCFFMAGVYFLPVPKPILPVFLFLVGMLVLFVAGVLVGRQGGREDNLGKLVSVTDLCVGPKYMVSRSLNGQYIVGRIVPAYGGYNSLPIIRAFDMSSTDLAEEIIKMPVGTATVVVREGDELRRMVGMMA